MYLYMYIMYLHLLSGIIDAKRPAPAVPSRFSAGPSECLLWILGVFVLVFVMLRVIPDTEEIDEINEATTLICHALREKI